MFSKRVKYTSLEKVGFDLYVNKPTITTRINKIVVKTHGTSKAETILSCVKQVKEIHESGFITKLKEGFADKI